ncbi:MAG: PQQ-binding-like beta-propeller repeat protein, partial [bacterium]
GIIGTAPSWATPAVAPLGMSTPGSFAEAVVYAVDDGSDLVAFNAGDGKELWRQQIMPLDRLHSTPLVAGDRIYVPSINHKLFAIERATGKAIWDFTCFGELRGTPLLDDNRLVFVSNDHFLYALDWETGKPIMQSLTPKPAPAVLDLTRGPARVEATPIDETVLRAEIDPVMAAVLDGINRSDETTLAGYMHDVDPMRQSTWAAAVVAAYKGLTLGQHSIATLDIASPGDIVAVLTISAMRGEKPVQIFLTPHLVKDVTKTPVWQIDPESLKPGTIRETPTLESPQ